MSKALEQLQQSIEAQKKRLAQMLAEKQLMDSRAKTQARLIAKKVDTRRKILLGAFLLSRLEHEDATIDVATLTIDGAHFASWLSRPEDCALFSLGNPAGTPRTPVVGAALQIQSSPAIAAIPDAVSNAL